MIWASQVAPGNENGLKLRVYGSKGGLEWTQADPNYLWYTPYGEPKRLITRAGAGAGPAAARVSRVPSGHPEGYLEGFANIYQEAARAIRAARRKGGKPPKDVIFPTVQDGVEGVAFVEACVQIVEEERRLDEAVGQVVGASFEARPAGSHLRMREVGADLPHPEVRAQRASKDAPQARSVTRILLDRYCRSPDLGWMIPPEPLLPFAGARQPRALARSKSIRMREEFFDV